jgi:hypothetical protein
MLNREQGNIYTVCNNDSRVIMTQIRKIVHFAADRKNNQPGNDCYLDLIPTGTSVNDVIKRVARM